MNFSLKNFNYIKILIFLCFCVSIFSLNYNLKNFDKLTYSNKGQFNHVMIKSDPFKYMSHGAEIKRDLKNGKNYFETGQHYFTKYLPARLAAAYYYIFDYNLFNNWSDKKINLGIHFYYLLIQCIIYYLSLFFLYLAISKKISKKICLVFCVFLGLEPTIFQYHGTFWSESIFFSIQLILLALVIKSDKSYINFFLIGIFLALLSIQRSPAFLYIIPIVIYFFIILKKKIYYKIPHLIIGYSLILLFVGYNNYIRSGVFYFVPNDTKSNISRYLVPLIINEKEQLHEKKSALKWIRDNNIVLDIEDNDKEISRISPYMFCEGSYIKNESNKLKYCNYLKSKTIKLLMENPGSTFKNILYNSFHTLVLNPFHIYSQHNLWSEKIYIENSASHKFISLRIFYSLLIFSISLIGFLIMLKNRDKKLLILFTLSGFYFFIAASWHGNPRYLTPVLIYISLFFGNGIISITDFFKKKLIR